MLAESARTASGSGERAESVQDASIRRPVKSLSRTSPQLQIPQSTARKSIRKLLQMKKFSLHRAPTHEGEENRRCFACAMREPSLCKPVKGPSHCHPNANASCQLWRFLPISMVTGDTFAGGFAALGVGLHSALTYALQRTRATPKANPKIVFLM